MEDRQSSYLSTGPSPGKTQNSAIRQPSAMETTSRLGQSSRTGQQSRIGQTQRPDSIMESKNEVIDKPVQNKSSSTNKNVADKTETRPKNEEQNLNGTKSVRIEETPVIEDLKKKLTYPIPKPPATKKAEIFDLDAAREIDKRVLNVHIELMQDLKTLVLQLTNKYYKDVEKVRAIFAWICSQQLDKLDYSLAITDKSPLHLLKEVKDKKSSYPQLFAAMCKCIDIPCHIVTGVAKLEGHDIGETEIDQNRVTWNVVYCADGWRIVFFQRAMDTSVPPKRRMRQEQDITTIKSTPLSSKTGSFKEITQNGKSSVPKLPAINSSALKLSTDHHHHHNHRSVSRNRGTIKSKDATDEYILKVNEYYFLTDPHEFIFSCFPDEDMWQLLGKPYPIEKFLKLPVLSQAFFDNNLKIISRLCGIRKAKNGNCTITIKRLDETRNVFLYHSLELVAAEEPNDVLELDFKHLVAVVHDRSTTHFHMRFPVAGVYDFKIYGGIDQEESDFLCSFKVNCEEPKIRFEPLPFVPEIGFGPSFVTERFGLRLVSKLTGEITIRGPDTVDIDFKMLKDIKVMAEMFHQTITSSELEEYISVKQHNDDLFITVGVPRNGEYVLKLMAKHRRLNKGFINVCNFLLMSEDPKKPRKPFETAADLMIRQQLMDTLKTSKNPDDIQMAIDKLNKEDLPDDGWLTRAYERLEYLKLARALRNGINRKNADLLEKAIQDAKQSDVADKLNNYITEGEQMLRVAENNPMFILDMKRTTISEVHRYKKPKPVMHDVMKATYLLLGENPKTVSSWDEIASLMRLRSRYSLLYRVKQFDKKTVDPSTVEEVSKLLKPYTLEEAKLSSAGVGTFYIWAKDVIKEFPKTTKTSQPQNDPPINEQVITETQKQEEATK